LSFTLLTPESSILVICSLLVMLFSCIDIAMVHKTQGILCYRPYLRWCIILLPSSILRKMQLQGSDS